MKSGSLKLAEDDLSKHVVFPNGYVWFVFLSALDIMLTRVILRLGGSEANGIAHKIVRNYGIVGLVAYKFLLVTLVILICEYIGRRKKEAARILLSIGIMCTCLPVLIAFALLMLLG